MPRPTAKRLTEAQLVLAEGTAVPPIVLAPGRHWGDAVGMATQRLWLRHPLLLLAALLGLAALARLSLLALLAAPHGGLGQGLCQFDCLWYQGVARHGYDFVPRGDETNNSANWAFFPLYPLLLSPFARLTQDMPGLSLAGSLISTACTIGFGLVGFLYLQATAAGRRLGYGAMLAWVGFLTLWPGTLYFTAPYSEALYALLMTGALLMAVRGRPLAAALGCALLGATRPTGMLFVPLILAERLRGLWRVVRREGWQPDLPGRAAAILLPLAIAPLGFVAFVLYLRLHMGDGFAFAHVQSAWGRSSAMPWDYLWRGLSADDWGEVLRGGRESLSVQAVTALLGLGLAAYLVMCRRYAEAWLLGASVLLACSTGLQSLPRFVLTNPVTILALFRVAQARLPTGGLWLLGLGLGLCQIWLAMGWFVHAPILS